MEQLLDRLNKAPNAAKFGGLLGVVALLTLATWYFFIDPEETRIKNLASQRDALYATLAEKQELAQNLVENRKELDRLQQQLQEALIELPQQKDIDELLAQLSDVGKKAGLEITSIQPQGETPDSAFMRIPIKMAVNGNYHEIALFMQEVGNMPRIVNVANIKLTSNQGQRAPGSDKVVLTGEFMATTFRFLDSSAVPAQ